MPSGREGVLVGIRRYKREVVHGRRGTRNKPVLHGGGGCGGGGWRCPILAADREMKEISNPAVDIGAV